MPELTTLPLKIVDGNHYGPTAYMSSEQTWNMYVSEDSLKSFPGFKRVDEQYIGGSGRGTFTSARLSALLFCVNNEIYIRQGNVSAKIGNIETYVGRVFFAENQASQIAICDQFTIYVYDYANDTFTKLSLDFKPGYIAFQNGAFIAPDITTASGASVWRLSAYNNGNSWPLGAQYEGSFQTKADQCLACIPFPGRGNTLLIIGLVVSELWSFTGNSDLTSVRFPYQRSVGINIDYGTVNSATIAFMDDFVVWVGSNETAGITVLYSSGSNIQQITDEGLNFQLENITNPKYCWANLFKVNGHLMYLFTFYHPDDNKSFLYDFTTKQFFFLCDELMDYYPLSSIAIHNQQFFFVSFNDANLYELANKYTTYNYVNDEIGNNKNVQIPRIRITATVRLPNNDPFIVNYMTFGIEQGIANDTPVVDVSISRNGGKTFGNNVRFNLNSNGDYNGKFSLNSLGRGNLFTPQFRFWSDGDIILKNGNLRIYK